MKALIAIASLSTLAIPLQCWRDCDCETVCPLLGAFACVGLVLFAGVAIHVVASIVWELKLLSR